MLINHECHEEVETIYLKCLLFVFFVSFVVKKEVAIR